MVAIFTILNLIFMVVMWNSATEAFEQNRAAVGWFLIAASAINGAAAAAYIF